MINAAHQKVKDQPRWHPVFILNMDQTSPIWFTYNAWKMLDRVGLCTLHVRKSTNETISNIMFAITATATGKLLKALFLFKGAARNSCIVLGEFPVFSKQHALLIPAKCLDCWGHGCLHGGWSKFLAHMCQELHQMAWCQFCIWTPTSVSHMMASVKIKIQVLLGVEVENIRQGVMASINLLMLASINC